jgi:hypothetical protein
MPICDPAYLRRIDPVWVNGPVPFRYWQDVAHRKDFLLWLGHKSRFRWMHDWYKLQFRPLMAKYGKGPIDPYWQGMPIVALRDCFPEYDWKEWLCLKLPMGFWDSRSNRRDYMRWLGEQLGYTLLDHWYAVRHRDFTSTGGGALLSKYQWSPPLAVIDLVPRNRWHEWRFVKVPLGFWDLVENRHRYLRWLGRKLGFRRPQDWSSITYDAIGDNYGHALLHRFPSLREVMLDFMPEINWDHLDKRRPITEDDILRWADTYHAGHGTWPTGSSGPIPGTSYTWQGIQLCLVQGHRGLPGGSSLAKLLIQSRGARPLFGRALTEKQILAWADAHFELHGKWPALKSLDAPAPGVKDTWFAIDSALRNGRRGLPGGSSLPRLLRKHGRKRFRE